MYEFKTGDRLAAFYKMYTSHGTFAEHAVAPDWTTTYAYFEEGATIPLTSLTGAVGLHLDLCLLQPFDPHPKGKGEKAPPLIHRAGSAVGAYSAKLARLSGMHRTIDVAAGSVTNYKDLVDYVFDYRRDEDIIVSDIGEILKKEELPDRIAHVFNATADHGIEGAHCLRHRNDQRSGVLGPTFW
jgi:NADPH:quinone reductase-like Zn-dependent oxidoreductase